jgi:hypothetical protein
VVLGLNDCQSICCVSQAVYCDAYVHSRQRLRKHIPEVTLSTVEGHPLPGSGSLNTFPQQRISNHINKHELLEVVTCIQLNKEYSGVEQVQLSEMK